MTRFLAFLVFSLPIIGRADSRSTFERDLALGISTGIRLYVATNKESLPKQWADLWATDIGALNKQLWQRKMEPLQGLYVFVPTNPIVLVSQKYKVMVVRYEPIKEEGRLGRYVVCQSPKNDILDGWVDEGDFQKALEQSGVKLPEPDTNEVRAAKEAIEKLIAREEVDRAIIQQSAPRPSLTERWAVLGEHVKSWLVAPKTNGASGGQLRWESVLVGVLVVGGLLVGGWHWLRQRR